MLAGIIKTVSTAVQAVTSGRQAERAQKMVVDLQAIGQQVVRTGLGSKRYTRWRNNCRRFQKRLVADVQSAVTAVLRSELRLQLTQHLQAMKAAAATKLAAGKKLWCKGPIGSRLNSFFLFLFGMREGSPLEWLAAGTHFDDARVTHRMLCVSGTNSGMPTSVLKQTCLCLLYTCGSLPLLRLDWNQFNSTSRGA